MAPILKRWIGWTFDEGMALDQSFFNESLEIHCKAEFEKANATSYDVYNLPQCPTFFQPLMVNNVPNKALFLVNRQAKQNTQAPQVYDVTLTYSNTWTNQNNFDKEFKFIENPLERPAMVVWGRYSTREGVEFSYSDTDTTDPSQPMTTTAGEPIVLEEEYHRRMLTVTKYVADVDNDIFAESGDFINEEDTTIGGHTFKKKTLWMLPIDISPIRVENGYFFYELTMTIYHNPKTWIRQIRNAGYYMKSPRTQMKLNPKNWLPEAFTPLLPIVDNQGQKLDRPSLLRKDGTPLTLVVTERKFNPIVGKVEPFKWSVQSPDDFSRAFTKDELDEATLNVRTRQLLNFTQSLPLR